VFVVGILPCHRQDSKSFLNLEYKSKLKTSTGLSQSKIKKMKTILRLLPLLLLAVYATCTVQDLMTAMTPTATSPGCISFSPYVDDLSPNYGSVPSESLIQTLLNNLVAQTSYRCIHIYDLGGIQYQNIVKVADSLGIKVLANIYISSTSFAISNIDGAIATANQYPSTLLGISCGSETIYESNNPTSAKQAVQSCVSQLRTGGVTQPVGYIDVFTGWCGAEDNCNNFLSDLESLVDFVGLDEFPWVSYWLYSANNVVGEHIFQSLHLSTS
jgi:exo-beta-1,3-glucanase (GH17 family)